MVSVSAYIKVINRHFENYDDYNVQNAKGQLKRKKKYFLHKSLLIVMIHGTKIFVTACLVLFVPPNRSSVPTYYITTTTTCIHAKYKILREVNI